MYRLVTIFLLLISFLYAEEDKSSFTVIPKGKSVSKDYFAVSSGIEISGTMMQDVYLAGSQVIIDGIIEGDVLVIAGTVEISGTVKGSVRAITGQLLISGSIGKSVSACCGNVNLTNSATIGGSVVIASGNVDLASSVGGGVSLAASNVRIAGRVLKDVVAYTGQLRVTSRAEVDGQLSYSSTEAIWLEPEARIVGGVHRTEGPFETLLHHRWIDVLLLSTRLAGLLMNFIYTFAMGYILLKFYGHTIDSTVLYLHHHPLRSFLHGVIVVIIVPLASLLLLMTILGVPFALTLIAVNIVGLYTAKIYVILYGSEKIFKWIGIRARHYTEFAVGTCIYFLLLLIPYVGITLSIVSMLAGLGAMVSIQMHKQRTTLQNKKKAG
jgi:hypothetical protein